MTPLEKAAKAIGDAIIEQDNAEFERRTYNGTEYICCDAANSGLEPEAIAKAAIRAFLEAAAEDADTAIKAGYAADSAALKSGPSYCQIGQAAILALKETSNG